MINRHQSTMQKLGVTVALVSALSIAGLGMSHAAPSNAPETKHVNGAPCNDLCKAYMAWSDRVMATFHPHPASRPQQRIAVRPKTPERMLHSASGTRRSNLDSFAQFRRRSTGAPQTAEMPQVEAAAPLDPIKPIAERLFQADANPNPNPNARPADVSATNESPEATPVSLTEAVFAMQDSSTEDHVTRGPDLRFALSLILALSICTLLVLLYRGRSRDRTEAANTFR